MAAPNFVNITSIVPHSRGVKPISADVPEQLIPGPPSGTSYKVNSILASNSTEESVAVAVSMRLTDETTFRALAGPIVIPPQATLVIVDKTTAIYLVDTSVPTEGNAIWVAAAAANGVSFVASYEALT